MVQVDIQACSPRPLLQTSKSRGNLTFHCSVKHSRKARTECSRCRKAENYKPGVRVPIPIQCSQWIKSFGLHQAPAVHICNSNSNLSPWPCFEINMCVAGWARVCMWNVKMLLALLPNFKTQALESKELRVLTRMQTLLWQVGKGGLLRKKVF